MAVRAPIHPFLKFLPELHTKFFSSHWLLFYRAVVETIDSSEKGMHPVTITIINPSERRLAWDRTSDLLFSSPVGCALPTELWGGLGKNLEEEVFRGDMKKTGYHQLL